MINFLNEKNFNNHICIFQRLGNVTLWKRDVIWKVLSAYLQLLYSSRVKFSAVFRLECREYQFSIEIHDFSSFPGNGQGYRWAANER